MRGRAMPRKRILTKKSPLRKIKGKYGEPEHWDGLSTLFVILIERSLGTASPSELDWLKHLKDQRFEARKVANQ